MAPDEFAAFAGTELIAAGRAAEVAVAARHFADAPDGRTPLIFGADGRQTDFDLRGTDEDIAARYAPPRRSPGRPKLGVVGREVTLLPRHWEWLNAQPGGASVALRKLVEAARKDTADASAIRSAQDAACSFMTALAGDLPGYEDATRALYAGDQARFRALVAEWPADVAAHARALAGPAFGEQG